MTQYYLTREDELYHWGIKGQKWGQRRWQNEDGSLTAAGREHYGYGSKEYYKSAKKEYLSADKEARRAERKASSLSSRYPISSKTSMVRRNQVEGAQIDAAKKRLISDLSKKKMDMAKQEYKNSDEYKARQEKIKKAAKIGLAVAGTALAVYGTYKLSNAIKDKAFQMSYNKGKKYAESILDSNMATGWTGFEDGSYELLNSRHQAIQTGKLNLNSWQKPTTQIAQLQGLNNRAAFKTYSNAMDDVRKDAEEVSKNTLTAAKYLLKNRKK